MLEKGSASDMVETESSREFMCQIKHLHVEKRVNQKASIRKVKKKIETTLYDS